MAKGKKGFKGPKDPFSDLPEDWREAVEGSSREEIESRIVKVVLDDVTLRVAKKDDQDLKEKQEAAAFAAGVYRDAFKANKLKIEFLKKALDDKGGPVNNANIDDLLKRIRSPEKGTIVSQKGIGKTEYTRITPPLPGEKMPDLDKEAAESLLTKTQGDGLKIDKVEVSGLNSLGAKLSESLGNKSP